MPKATEIAVIFTVTPAPINKSGSALITRSVLKLIPSTQPV